ncbi:putative type VI secretion system effector [Iodobacter sp.]|uniref:putative type VI secretion system effector n=1 Tax=Iodobacter sp. TaxID=1915058 RepID=UPI0025EFBC5F|nr:putative type VI secretion system effector [Iodobacter sp.]
MKLKKDTGIINNLKIVRAQQNILYSPHMKQAASVSAIIFAVAGMGAAAVQTSSNSEAGADDVDLYSFMMNGVQYAGCTREALFKEGDEVDLVYEKNEQGNEVYGVRRASTRSIWLYPYMSCGTKASVIRALKLWTYFSLGGGGFIFVGITVGNFALGKGLVDFEKIILMQIAVFLITAIGFSIFLPRLYRFSLLANEVFSVFGFENPKWMDLHKTSNEFRKKNKVSWTGKNALDLWY